MPSETPVQPDRSSNDVTSRHSEAQPGDSASMAVTGRLPAVLRIQFSGMGRKVPRRVDRSKHADEAPAIDVGGGDTAMSQVASAELVPSP